jgi:large subunit ribosomal protein L19
MDKLKLVEQTQVRDDLPEINPGDTVNVHYRVREGDKERIQQYQGVVIAERGSGANRTFTVRKISGSVGVERIFLVNSPYIAKIDVVRRGKVRRSKLFYLRERRGKSARIREKEDQNRTNKAKKA